MIAVSQHLLIFERVYSDERFSKDHTIEEYYMVAYIRMEMLRDFAQAQAVQEPHDVLYQEVFLHHSHEVHEYGETPVHLPRFRGGQIHVFP